jgi:hypothetical protein
MPATKDPLYTQLKEAYAEANLNRITAALLELYRSRQHAALREIARRVSAVLPIEDARVSKCFSQLVMLYHPDKGALHRREIDTLAERNPKELHRYSHILLLGDFKELPRESSAPEGAEFTAEYMYDVEEEERKSSREWDEQTFEDEQFADPQEEYANTFFQALKMKYYGTLEIELPYYYLKEFEEIEMAESGIESLDGIGYCTHATVVDISGNSITDVSDLQNLTKVTELYCSGNQIGYIDSLSSLINLRIVDLSMNEIDDISPLLELEHLELVNVVGNPIPENQIKALKAKKCTVLS